jgi:hypothetical protein
LFIKQPGDELLVSNAKRFCAPPQPHGGPDVAFPTRVSIAVTASKDFKMKANKWVVIFSAIVASLLCSVNPAPAAEPITSANLGSTIVNWATSWVNRRAIGDGQCTRLVEAALGVTGCKPGRDYVWGRALKDGEKMQMGDIIQFTSFVIKDGGFTWNLGAPNHTAIFIEEKDGKVYVVHQNVDGEPAQEKSRVRIHGYNFAKKVSGSFIVYRPELK